MRFSTKILFCLVASLLLGSCCKVCWKDADAKVEAIIRKLRSARYGPLVCPSGQAMKDLIGYLRRRKISEKCQEDVLSFAHKYLRGDEVVMWLPDLLGALARMGNKKAVRELQLICLLPQEVCCSLYFPRLWFLGSELLLPCDESTQKLVRENVLMDWEVLVNRAAENLACYAPNEAVTIFVLAGLASTQKRKLFKPFLAKLLGANSNAEFRRILIKHQQKIREAVRNARELVIPHENIEEVLAAQTLR